LLAIAAEAPRGYGALLLAARLATAHYIDIAACAAPR